MIDVFSILLPGALLSALLWTSDEVQSLSALQLLTGQSEAAGWVAFAFASYALGHFLFLLASQLDGPLYDRYRKRKWPKQSDLAFNAATELRNRRFEENRPPPILGSSPPPGEPTPTPIPMNTFQWAKSVLMIEAPDALADVNRYEADSKFFRSLVVVLALVGIAALANAQWIVGTVAVVLAGASFLRYAERRYKSTLWAYHYVIVLDQGPLGAAVGIATADILSSGGKVRAL